MSLMTERHDAIAETMAEVRTLSDQLGPTDELIEALKPVLIALGMRDDLFPQETFSVTPGGTMTIYEVSCGQDRELGLYASAGLPGKYQPAHDHRTWSLIAGIRGAEHNRYFERVTPGGDFDEAKLEPRGELTLRRGTANGQLGDKFHAIEVIDEGPALHLHLYGHTLDTLQGRIFYESETGGVAKPFMSKPNLHTALVTAAELDEMRADDEALTMCDASESNASCECSTSERIVVTADSDPEAHAFAHELRRSGHLNLAILAGDRSWQ